MGKQSKFSVFKDWAIREWDGEFPLSTAIAHSMSHQLKLFSDQDSANECFNMWATTGRIKMVRCDSFGAWYKIVG